MSINYEWQFNPLESYPTASGQSDVVFKVHYQLTASTGSLETLDFYSRSAIGVVPVEYVSGSEFIPYNQLTKDIVYSWVSGSLGEDYINSMKQNLSNQIEDIIHPTVLVQQAPWL
jgi:hypothetical protein